MKFNVMIFLLEELIGLLSTTLLQSKFYSKFVSIFVCRDFIAYILKIVNATPEWCAVYLQNEASQQMKVNLNIQRLGYA